MKYLSLFSGIGGFELGIQQAYEICNADGSKNGGSQIYKTDDEGQGLFSPTREGITTSERPISECITNITDERPFCIGYSEIDKYATQIYQSHFPEHKNYGDITKINADTLPNFELLVGGFPCQAFSIAGKRKGFDDTRGTLFFEIARILQAKQPRLFLLENVKGLLSHDNGQTFSTIISTLDELGYDLQWQVLNSKNHGVPQNRERVFIVGHLRGTSRPEVFPFGENDSNVNGSDREKLSSTGIARCLTATEHKQHGDGNYIRQLNNPTHSNNRIYNIGGTLNTAQGGNRQPKIPEGLKIRRLTPKECERLQGFPDGWTLGVSDTQRYKCLGNAVTVNVIKDIMEKLYEQVR